MPLIQSSLLQDQSLLESFIFATAQVADHRGSKSLVLEHACYKLQRFERGSEEAVTYLRPHCGSPPARRPCCAGAGHCEERAGGLDGHLIPCRRRHSSPGRAAVPYPSLQTWIWPLVREHVLCGDMSILSMPYKSQMLVCVLAAGAYCSMACAGLWLRPQPPGLLLVQLHQDAARARARICRGPRAGY